MWEDLCQRALVAINEQQMVLLLLTVDLVGSAIDTISDMSLISLKLTITTTMVGGPKEFWEDPWRTKRI